MTEAVRAGEVCSSAVDVLVNNAGYGYRVAVEEGDEADVAALFATNFFGAELAELADWEANQPQLRPPELLIPPTRRNRSCPT